MPRNERPWDCGIPSNVVCDVRKRRHTPDGVERTVTRKLTKAGLKNQYPWSEMFDGDFFIVPITGTRNSMQVAFRQAAARHDIEVTIHDWKTKNEDGEEVPAYRVCRITSGIAKIKEVARAMGKHAPSSDVRARYARSAAHRRGEDVERPLISVAPSVPTDAPGGVGSAPVAPLGTDAAMRYDREQRLAEARRRAALELAGLDPDEDEDIMGVGGA